MYWKTEVYDSTRMIVQYLGCLFVYAGIDGLSIPAKHKPHELVSSHVRLQIFTAVRGARAAMADRVGLLAQQTD